MDFTLTDTFVKGQVKGACSFSDLQDRATPEGDLSGGSGEGQALFVLDSKALPPKSDKLLPKGGGSLSPPPLEASLYPAYRVILDTGVSNSRILRVSAGWGLPGQGVKKMTCGVWGTTGEGCSRSFSRHKESCDSIGCPICWPEEVSGAVREGTDRIWQIIMLYGVAMGHLRHIQVSLPRGKGWGGVEGYQEGRKFYEKAKLALDRLLKKIGCKGGIKVFHPYRLKHLDGSTCPEKEVCRREHKEVWGPHFHLIGWGFLENSADVFKKTGWVYKMIRPMESPGDVAVVLRYLLGHAGVLYDSDGVVHNKMVSYFGLASGRKIGCRLSYVDVDCGCGCGEKKQLYMIPEPWLDPDRALEYRMVEGVEWACLGNLRRKVKTYFKRENKT